MGLLILIILVFLVTLLSYYGKRTEYSRKARSKTNRVDRLQPKYSQQFLELKQQIRELAQIAWSTERAFGDTTFCLEANALAQINSPQQVLDIFLTHARRIAPGFAVPHLVPHVYIARMPRFWAGAFEVDSEIAPPKELETLHQRLNQLTRDIEVSQLVMRAARNKFPDRSEVELLRIFGDRTLC